MDTKTALAYANNLFNMATAMSVAGRRNAFNAFIAELGIGPRDLTKGETSHGAYLHIAVA